MEHPNHRIKEAICAFHFESFSNEFEFEKWSEDIKSKFSEINLNFSHEIKPVSISIELTSEETEETPKVTKTQESGNDGYIFQAGDNNRVVILSKDYISFHNIHNYRGWELFLNELIMPCLSILLEYNKDCRLMNAQMTYINHFEADSNDFIVGEWLEYAIRPTKFDNAFDWIQNHQTVFKTNDNSAELTLISRYIIPEKGIPFLYLLSGANVNSVNDDNSLLNYKTIAQKAHDLANKLFRVAVTQKTLDFISQEKI